MYYLYQQILNEFLMIYLIKNLYVENMDFVLTNIQYNKIKFSLKILAYYNYFVLTQSY